MRELIIEAVKKYRMFDAGDNVVVGLSGGADSVLLLHALIDARDEIGLGEIYAAHVNHNLRGEDSKRDELFVRELCKSQKVGLNVLIADVLGFSREKKISIEQAGRIIRYKHFEETRVFFNAQKIAVGHNMDDNAETVIMNLCRGAGLKGLGGIQPVKGFVTRPLIDTSRSEIEGALSEHGIFFVTDKTNLADDYTRNRVRNLIVPALKEHVNPRAAAAVARNAAWIRDDEAFLEQMAHEAFEKVMIGEDGEVSVDIEKLMALPEPILRRAVRASISLVREGEGLMDISASHIALVLDTASGRSGRVGYIPGVVVAKEYSRLVFRSGKERAGGGFFYPLCVNVPTYIHETGKLILVSTKPPDKKNPPDTKQPNLCCTKTFEYDNVVANLVLRTRARGDRITLGNRMSRTFTKKLQDLFTDKKIPAPRRDRIPLLAHESDILWITGEIECVNVKYQYDESISTCQNLLWVSIWE